jgi:hypothetical protein
MSQQPDPSALPDLPIVTFGEIKEAQPVVDWRVSPDSDDDDDTLLPPEILADILGFDPRTVDLDGNDIEEAAK